MPRRRYPYRGNIEEPVLDELAAQSELVGLRPTSYLERVIGLAHGFESPYVRPVGELPTAVSAADLQAFTAGLTPEQCTRPVANVGTRGTYVRVDEPLGERINAWCDAHDVGYSQYLRAIIRYAAGFPTVEDLVEQGRRRGVQGTLPGVAGEGQKVAS